MFDFFREIIVNQIGSFSGMIEIVKTFILGQIKTNHFFSGGLLIGLFLAIPRYITPGLNFIYGKIKKQIIYTMFFDETDLFLNYFNFWLQDMYPHKFRNVQIKIDNSVEDDEDEGLTVNPKTRKDFAIKQKPDSFMIFYKKMPFFISKQEDKLENTNSKYNFIYGYYYITSFSKKYSHKLVKDIVEKYGDTKDKMSYNVYTSKLDSWVYHGKSNGRSMESVVINKKIKKQIITDMDTFIKSKDWYYKKGINYKFVSVYNGSPGSGKSSLIRAIVTKYKMKVHYLNLADKYMSDDTLMVLMANLINPGLVVIEDIDSIFNKRKNLTGNTLTFSGFINILDGVATRSGLIVIITTNKIETLDKALLRSGRVDQIYKICEPTIIQVKEYFKMFFNKELKISQLDYSLKKMSMAKIQKICINNKNNNRKAEKEINILFKK